MVLANGVVLLSQWLARGEGRGLRTFNGRIVFVHEVALDELDGQATFSDTSTSNNHQLVFPEELDHMSAWPAA